MLKIIESPLTGIKKIENSKEISAASGYNLYFDQLNC